MYYALEFDPEFGVPAVLSESEPGPDLKYLRGLKLETDEAPLDLRLESDEARDAYPDFLNALRAPAASVEFVKALVRAGVDNVEWFPTSIHAPGRLVAGYHVMNVVGRISCLDETASTVTRFRGKVARIKSLHLDERRARGAKMFRLQEYPELILMAEDVSPYLQGLTGFVLMPADGWSDAHRF